MIFITTLKQVICNIEEIKNIEIEDLENRIIEAFDGYDYEGEEEVVGFDNWCDVSVAGSHEVNLKIDHEDAYLLTIYITNQDGKVTITNVL